MVLFCFFGDSIPACFFVFFQWLIHWVREEVDGCVDVGCDGTGHDHLLTTHELSLKCVYNVIVSDKVSALSYYRRHTD